MRKFAYLVEAGNFTKAARELHISQPALSSAIAKLERELKTRLLVRGSRPLALTPAGQLAYQTAKDLSVQADNLKLRLAELAQEQLYLKIGMIDSVANALFADGEGLEMLKDAKVSLIVNNSRYLTEAVERGELDIALIAERQNSLPAILESQPVAAEPLVLVGHAKRRAAPGSLLPDFIAYDQLSTTFRLVSGYLNSKGVQLQTSFYSTSPEVMLRLVLLNKGVAALPYLMVREQLNNGELRRVGPKQPWLIPRNIVAIKRRDRDLPLPLKKLINQTTGVLDGLTAELQAT